LGIDVHSNDGKMATSYQDPNWRIVCFIRRGNNIVVALSYSFAAMNIQAGNESVQRVYPWLKYKPDMDEIPGSQSLPLSTLLVGLNGPKIMAPTENFPAKGPLKRFTKSINAILRHHWTSMGGKIAGEIKPLEAGEKFAEMNEEEKQAFIEKIAVNAVGAPMKIDSDKFKLVDVDNLQLDLNLSPNVKDKNVHAGVFYFSEEQEKEIAEHFKSKGVPILGSIGIDGQPPKRYGVWVCIFDDEGNEKGMFYFINRVGTGFYFPPDKDIPEGSGESKFYPSTDPAQYFGGLDDPRVREMVGDRSMPPRENFELPEGADPNLKKDKNYDYYSYIEKLFNFFKSKVPPK